MSKAEDERGRERLPNRRQCESFEFALGTIPFVVSVGRYPDGRLGELFLSSVKCGSAADTNARDSAITFSIAIQSGADPEVIRRALCRDETGAALSPLGRALDLLAEFGGGGAP